MARRLTAQNALDMILSQAADDSDVEDADQSGEESLSDADYEQESSSLSSDEDALLSDAEPDARGDVGLHSDAESAAVVSDDNADQNQRDGGVVIDADAARRVDEAIDAVYQRCRGHFEGADGTIWEEDPILQGRRQAVNVMRAPGGLSAFSRRHCDETALSNWRVFIDDEFLDAVVVCTKDKSRSLGANFVTDKQELTTFLGVSILIGVYKGRGEPIRAMWSETEGRKCISQFMLCARFEQLTKYLRFDLTNTRPTRRMQTKFAPMGSLYDLWEQKLSRAFIPYEYVTVDETLVPFRGRCNFKQYMPSKPAKYGLKFWCLCDAKTAYCLRMRPYLGTDHGAVRTAGLGKKTVLDLTERLDAGRTVVTDNFFTSLDLLRDLRARRLGLIGTVRKNRRELPPEFTTKRSEAGSSLFGFNEDAALVSYAPKKNKRVVLMSSEHSGEEIDPGTGKPEIIMTYNRGKGGVDHLDQMCGAYTTRKRTTRWPKVVFQHMVDVTAYNAFILWGEVTGTTRGGRNRRQFLKMLGAELCGGELDEAGNIKLIAKQVAAAATPGGRLRCRQCIANKTVQRCKSCANPLCINCASYTCPDC